MLNAHLIIIPSIILNNNLLYIIQGAQEPLWVTLLCVVLYFFAFFIYYLPKELKRRKEIDMEYCKRKGISYDELIKRRNISRARKIPNSTRNYILNRDGYRCKKCGSTSNLQIDHIYPFSQGGGNEASNLQVLCRNCTLSKGATY